LFHLTSFKRILNRLFRKLESTFVNKEEIPRTSAIVSLSLASEGEGFSTVDPTKQPEQTKLELIESEDTKLWKKKLPCSAFMKKCCSPETKAPKSSPKVNAPAIYVNPSPVSEIHQMTNYGTIHSIPLFHHFLLLVSPHHE
jgi:hypothetical protein